MDTSFALLAEQSDDSKSYSASMSKILLDCAVAVSDYGHVEDIEWLPL